MKRIIGALTLLLFSFSANAQNSKTVEIYFNQGSSVIDRGHAINDDMLCRLADRLSTLAKDSSVTISKIKINSYTSPEGGMELNDNLSLRRAEVICDYINSLGLNIHDSLFDINSHGIAWDGLRSVVSRSDMPHKEDIIRIIDEVPEESWAKLPSNRGLQLVDSRNKQLMDLRRGEPYRYMMANIFPALRKSSVVTIYFKKEIAPIIKEEVAVQEKPEEVKEVTQEEVTQEEVTQEAELAINEKVQEPIIKPLFALKTNLLYDAITAINLELEVPIGQRWSIAAEWIFPWWSSCGKSSNDWQRDSNRNSFQLLQGNLEGKYWFGNRANRTVMTGWYAGLYGGAGKYDLEHKAKGYQGEFYTVALSGGYAHTINRSGNLRMEYSLGAGYMQSDYTKYKEHLGIDDKWHAMRQESGTLSWFGPTKAKISLVWMLNHKVNKEVK